jgi:peroxiredoxin
MTSHAFSRRPARRLLFAALLACGSTIFLVSTETPAAEADLSVDTASAETPTAEPAEAAAIPAGHSYHGETFSKGPRQAAVLLDGMGNVVFASSAKSPETQAFINQGVAALHGFWYLEAERSFRQAAKLEPELAIAYWGMAQANANNESRAKDFVAKAVERRDGASPREQLYIDGLANYLKKPEEAETKEQTVARHRRYIDDLEKAIDDYPEDIEAKALLALRLWLSRDELPIVSHRAVDALLGEVFAANPLHPAHHYRIHLWDGVRPKNALHSSAMCGPSLPGIAHMWHMPGHIYSKLHRYGDAVWQQEASARADHAHMVRTRLMPDQIHNFAHNNEWLVRNLLFLGQVETAIIQSRNLIAMPQHPEFNSLTKQGSFLYGRKRLLDTLTQYELWERLISEAEGPFLPPTGDEALADELTGWMVAAYHLSGRQADAKRLGRALQRRRIALETEILDLEEALEALNDEERKSDERTKRLDELRKKLKEVAKQIAKGDAAAAVIAKDAPAVIRQIESAGDIEAVLAASWIGQAGDSPAAIERLEKLVNERPGETRPLAILAEHLWHAGRQDDAVKSFETLRQVAGYADLGTPILTRIKPVAEKAGAPEDWRIRPEPAGDIGQRPELDSLGPATWSSYTAPNWKAWTTEDVQTDDDAYQGKAKIVVFYLGFGCLHCVEQLKALKPKVQEFADAGIEIVAISTETVAELRKGIESYGEPLPMTILADPEREAFRAFRCWDDFEDQPLHGTFLIAADGRVLWQDIGYEPFNDIGFLQNESARLLATPRVSEK